MTKLLRFTAELPFYTTFDNLERLQGLGAVRPFYDIEGESRRQVIRDITAELTGWDRNLSDPNWWSARLSRGRRVS